MSTQGLWRYRHVAPVISLGIILSVFFFNVVRGSEFFATQSTRQVWGVLAAGALITALLVVYMLTLIPNPPKDDFGDSP